VHVYERGNGKEALCTFMNVVTEGRYVHVYERGNGKEALCTCMNVVTGRQLCVRV